MSAADSSSPVDPRRCPARSKRTGIQCGQRAGAGTDHQGMSVCKWHGGRTPIQHGRFSKIPRKALTELQRSHSEDPRLLDLTREVAAARAVLDLFMQRFGDRIQGRSVELASAVAGRIADLIDVSSKVIERAEKIKAQNAISQPEFYRLMRELGRVVEQYVPDEPTRKRIGEAWLTIRFLPEG